MDPETQPPNQQPEISFAEMAVADLLDAFSRYSPPGVPKWIGSSET